MERRSVKNMDRRKSIKTEREREIERVSMYCRDGKKSKRGWMLQIETKDKDED